MHISDEGLVAGSVNRAELAAAYQKATDKAVRANLAAAGAEHGMYVEGGRLVDPSTPEPAPDADTSGAVDELEKLGATADSELSRPVVADNKAAWVDWAVSQGLDREEAEAYTKADLIELYADKE